ncbi:hypothetical protein SAMN04488514_110141 [Kriegella aquimaris]|uniref:NAD dependent epimerase/dehydratase family protein n=1 Tax=Kriegella aquimaris TaxID=192904 RepID=A0A1G9U6K0_9FLAO|nr:hypothetical protein SAMN04488514_110141 [Kriegella aquimaris]
MKLSVTAATGFIGLHLAKNLDKNRQQIVRLNKINDFPIVKLKVCSINKVRTNKR